MLRDPAPLVGTRFNAHFADLLASALHGNQAIHDGAVMIGRATLHDHYAVGGWSHRLHPPPTDARVPNKGSAFNSCLAMSSVTGVDALCLIARDATLAFERGKVSDLGL